LEFFADDDGIRGSFVIDMGTINTTDLEGENKGKLDGHLSAPDFFDVEAHPTAKFKLSKMSLLREREDSETTHKVTGELTIKDITHSIQFPAKVVIDGDNMTATADLSIDRTMWDVQYGSAGNVLSTLKDKVIYDDIELTLNISAMKDDTLVEEVVEGTKKIAEKIGDGVKKVAEKVGDKIKKDDDGDGVKKATEGVKDATEKVGGEMKDGVEKVGDKIKKDDDGEKHHEDE